jgi:hypothetical protein
MMTKVISFIMAKLKNANVSIFVIYEKSKKSVDAIYG